MFVQNFRFHHIVVFIFLLMNQPTTGPGKETEAYYSFVVAGGLQ